MHLLFYTFHGVATIFGARRRAHLQENKAPISVSRQETNTFTQYFCGKESAIQTKLFRKQDWQLWKVSVTALQPEIWHLTPFSSLLPNGV